MFGSRSVKNFFSGFAWLLMFAPLLAYPLAFGKMWRGRVPFFGEVPGVDFSVLALLAAGCVTVALPMLFRLLERDRGIRLLVAGGGLGCLAVLLQQGMFGMNLVALLSGIGYFLLPKRKLLYEPNPQWGELWEKAETMWKQRLEKITPFAISLCTAPDGNMYWMPNARYRPL